MFDETNQTHDQETDGQEGGQKSENNEKGLKMGKKETRVREILIKSKEEGNKTEKNRNNGLNKEMLYHHSFSTLL
jgi:hypothetical protein